MEEDEDDGEDEDVHASLARDGLQSWASSSASFRVTITVTWL